MLRLDSWIYILLIRDILRRIYVRVVISLSIVVISHILLRYPVGNLEILYDPGQFVECPNVYICTVS
jgi:hypothetical protein